MGDSLVITVALLEATAATHMLNEGELARPYSERRKVALTVSSEERLGDVLRRAAGELDVPFYEAFVGFYRPEHEREPVTALSPVVTLVDDEGRATWNHRFAEVPYSELLRAGDAGALEGDPYRPYLAVQPGIGDGVLPDWPTIKAVWDGIYFVLENIDTVGGAAFTSWAVKRQVFDRLKRRSKAVSDVIQGQASEWSERRGEPYALEQWLGDRPWSSPDLAGLLGCTEPEAQAVLWAFGFEQAPSGLWRRGGSEEAKFFEEVKALGFTSVGASDDQLRQAVAAEVRAFLESGRARPLAWDELEWNRPPGAVRRASYRIAAPYYWAREWWSDR